MWRLKTFVESIWTPMYTGAPTGHNNRVLFARTACILAVGVVAAVVAAVGAAASRFPITAGAVGLVAVGVLIGWLGPRLAVWLGLIDRAPANPLAPFTRADRPS